MPKAQLSVLQLACKQTRANSTVSKPIASQIIEQCSGNDSYSRLAMHTLEGEAKLIAKTVQYGRFKRKAICFQYGDGSFAATIPITSAKLWPQARPRLCSKCKSACNRPKNLATLRASIAEQIVDYKTEVKAELMLLAGQERTVQVAEAINRLTHCAISGAKLQAGQVHVDHAYPFSKLVTDWLQLQPAVCLCKTKLWLKRYALFVEQWKIWHKHNAVLQLTSAKSNLQKGAR